MDTQVANAPPLTRQNGQDGRNLFAGYSKEERPLAAYAGLVGLYQLALAVFLATASCG